MCDVYVHLYACFTVGVALPDALDDKEGCWKRSQDDSFSLFPTFFHADGGLELYNGNCLESSVDTEADRCKLCIKFEHKQSSRSEPETRHV